MTTITFDMLAYAKRLRDAGIPELQAEAQAAALTDILKSGAVELATKTDLAELATKADVAELQQNLTRLENKLNWVEERFTGRFDLLYWMIGFQLAIMVAVLWKLIR